MCLFLFIGGGGSYFALMHSVIQPRLQAQGMLSNLEYNILSISVILFMGMFYYLLPYVFLVSAIALVKIRIKLLKWILLLPSVILFLLELDRISEGIRVDRLHIWAGLYITAGCIFYVLSIFKAGKNPDIKSNTVRLNIIFIPIMLVILLKDYLFVEKIGLAEGTIIFEKNISLTINSNFIDLWLLCLFFFYSIRYGILGLKLKIEKHRLEASMSSLSFGTTIINHTIKNEIQKLDYMLERAKYQTVQSNRAETLVSLEKMETVTQHLHTMVQTIKQKSDEIVLTQEPIFLTELINGVLSSTEPILEEHQVIVNRQFEFDRKLICDPNHIREVLSNLILNAVDSMKGEKRVLVIKVAQVRNAVVLEVNDSGSGIEKRNFTKVFEPFFTTKNSSSTNYGLGLTYCYNVMKKHQGQIKIVQSEKDKGTTMVLIFPKKRIVELERRVTNEEDKGFVSRG
jgi:two-component system, sporulation sensor kinase B